MKRKMDKEKKKIRDRNWYLKHKKEHNSYTRKYYLSHREEILKKDKERNLLNPSVKLKYRKSNRNKISEYNHSYMGRFSTWKYKAKLRKLKWELTLDHIKSLPLVCHYTSKKLTLDANKDNTISLDRIDNTRGYIKENVVLCCSNINIMKNTLPIKTFISLCKEVTLNYSEKQYEM
jgi:hypothetical protein